MVHQLIHQLIQQQSRCTGPAQRYEVIDLSQWNLPLFDEPGVPARDPPVHAHTQAWQKKIRSFSAFIFITPQYNWGYPAALKNAVDYLYHEWKGKPAVIISYGTRGGGRAADQLKQVLTGLRMQVIPTMPALILTEAHAVAGVTDSSIAEHFSPHAKDIELVAQLLEEALLDPAQPS